MTIVTLLADLDAAIDASERGEPTLADLHSARAALVAAGKMQTTLQAVERRLTAYGSDFLPGTRLIIAETLAEAKEAGL